MPLREASWSGWCSTRLQAPSARSLAEPLEGACTRTAPGGGGQASYGLLEAERTCSVWAVLDPWAQAGLGW